MNTTVDQSPPDWRRHHEEVEALAALGSWSWDPHLDLHWWSPQLRRLLDVEEDTDASLDAFLDRVADSDRDRVRAHFEAAASGRAPDPIECRLNGEPLSRRVRVTSAAGRDGARLRLLTVVQDVTAAHAREEELRRAKVLLDQAQTMAQVGSWVWDPVQDHLEISPAMRQIFGIGPDLEPSVGCLLRLVHPDDAASFTQAVEAIARHPGPATTEVRIVREDGERHLALVARPLQESDGAKIAGVVLDITDRRRLEAQLRWSETLRALSGLASGIAHEFNNLLTVIVGHAQVLHDKAPSDDLKAILEAAKTGAELTRRLLAFARESPAEERPVVLEQEVADGARILSRLVGGDLHIELALASEPTRVKLDPAHLHRVLLSLAENARDAMPQSGTLRISTAPKSVEGRPGVELIFADDGVGMDEDTRRRATEPFFTTKGPGKGDGMGLAIVYGLVEQMGGTFELRSEPGRGTEAVVWLPRTEEELPESDRPRRPSRPERRVVLLVEDDPLVRRLVKRVLERAGYEVLLAEGPDQALAVAQDQPFDVLLTDLTMPSGGGRRLAEALRAERPTLPVLYMTGFSPDVEGLEAPVLFKPFQPEALLRALETLVG